MYFLLSLSHCVKSYGHFRQILAIFTVPTHQIWSCHVSHVANFENFNFLPNSIFNVRKSVENLSTSEVISQKPHGVESTPPPLVPLGVKYLKFSASGKKLIKISETGREFGSVVLKRDNNISNQKCIIILRTFCFQIKNI